MEQMGSCMMLNGMPKAGEQTYDDADREIYKIIHEGDGGGGSYEDEHVDNSELT